MKFPRRVPPLDTLVGRGENPRGPVTQTANGTALFPGTGWNKALDLGPRPEVEPGGAWPASPGGRWGKSTRTGE